MNGRRPIFVVVRTTVDHSRGEPHLIIEQRAGEKKQGFTQYIPLRDAHNVAIRGPQVR
jgi:hypothetical protein